MKPHNSSRPAVWRHVWPALVTVAVLLLPEFAHAADFTIPFICGLAQFIGGPLTFLFGLVAIVVGAIFLGMADHNAVKFLGGVMAAVGFACAAPLIMQKFGNNACSLV